MIVWKLEKWENSDQINKIQGIEKRGINELEKKADEYCERWKID